MNPPSVTQEVSYQILEVVKGIQFLFCSTCQQCSMSNRQLHNFQQGHGGHLITREQIVINIYIFRCIYSKFLSEMIGKQQFLDDYKCCPVCLCCYTGIQFHR